MQRSTSSKQGKFAGMKRTKFAVDTSHGVGSAVPVGFSDARLEMALRMKAVEDEHFAESILQRREERKQQRSSAAVLSSNENSSDDGNNAIVGATPKNNPRQWLQLLKKKRPGVAIAKSGKQTGGSSFGGSPTVD